MRQLLKALKCKVKRWRSSVLRWGKFGVIVASNFFIAFASLALSLLLLLISPLIVLAVFIAVALTALRWKFTLKPFHPLVRQLGSHEEQKRKRAFQQLLQMGNEAIPLFVQALNTPVVPAPYGDWCGFWAHRLAVEGLGRLKARGVSKVLLDALEHRDAGVKAKAAWALGEIGAEEAVPKLLPLLVYEADPSDQEEIELKPSVRQSAREALEKLGKSELAEALLQVLERERDEEAVEQLHRWFPQYRSAIVRALLNALQGSNLFAATQAAWALSKLNAVEALPTLERLAYSFFAPKELRQVCRESVSWLSSITTLPSPADLTRTSTENLPAIPNSNAIPTDTLPIGVPLTEKATDKQGFSNERGKT
ncbi:MAG: HEAT repeat domain-containing protein [Armatimonadota bacterium]